MDGEKGERRARRAVFSVRGVDCVTCALAIEKRLKKLDGVEKVGSAIMIGRVFVEYDGSKVGASQIEDAIRDAGYASYLTRD